MDDFLESCANPNPSEANQIFATLVQVLVAATCSLSKQNEWPKDYGPKLLTESKEFDYIVVGAGSAGAIIAGRLSEASNNNVLVLEAGEDPPFSTVVPALYTSFLKTKFDWEFYAEPSTKHSLEIKNGRSYIPQGKVLGGSGSINGMVYIRGNRQDYDSWEAKGNTGWGYDSVLKYFKKTESLQSKELLESDQGKYRGTDGEIPITYNSDISVVSGYFIEAAKELGYDFKEDINTGNNNLGMFRMQQNIKDGIRFSTATAFLQKEKDNLHIVKNALVSKILIDKLKKRATGVEFINREGETISVNASKEVIISGGAIKSPQILMLSGIGPAKQLHQLKIPVIADLPAGLNLQDHFLVLYAISLVNDPSETEESDEMDALYDYLMHRTGPLATVTDVTGFINSSNRTDNYPLIQICKLYCKRNSKDLRKTIFFSAGHSEDFIQSIEKENEKSSILIVATFLLHPKSTGEIKLRSSEPLAKPIIDLKFLDKEEDVDAMLQTARFVQKLTKTSAMRKMGAKVMQPVIKSCDGLKFASDRYWICYCRSVGQTGHHFGGSVKMGPVRDKTSVVNHRLKVHGINALRVADASIMPTVVSGNTNAATIMIGEKAADMIIEDASKL